MTPTPEQVEAAIPVAQEIWERALKYEPTPDELRDIIIDEIATILVRDQSGQRDTERLDWLDTGHNNADFLAAMKVKYGRNDFNGREEIDAAMPNPPTTEGEE